MSRRSHGRFSVTAHEAVVIWDNLINVCYLGSSNTKLHRMLHDFFDNLPHAFDAAMHQTVVPHVLSS